MGKVFWAVVACRFNTLPIPSKWLTHVCQDVELVPVPLSSETLSKVGEKPVKKVHNLVHIDPSI